MYCKSCGAKIDEDSKFCSYCGIELSLKSYSPFKEQKKSREQKQENQSDVFESPYQIQEDTIEDYDNSYTKETEATLVGILILVGMLLSIIFKPFEFDNSNSYNQFKIFAAITTLLLRILITIWVVNIAKRQNRNSFNWGIFAFLLPSIALIIIGMLRKIKYQIVTNNALTPLENYNTLVEEADSFIKQNRIKEAELIYQHIYENYESNDRIIFTLAELYFNNEKFDKSEKLLKLVANSEVYSANSNHYLGFIAMKKGEIKNALKYLEISSNNNHLKSIILRNVIQQDKIQKIDFVKQKSEYGLDKPINYNSINIQLDTLTGFESIKNYSQTNLEIFENYIVINFFKTSFNFKKESFIFNYRMIKNFERIIHNHYKFTFNDGNIIQFKINNTLDMAKEYEKKIKEKMRYFESVQTKKDDLIS